MFALTCEIQVAGRFYNDPHQGEVETSHFGSDFRFFTALIQIMGTQQAVNCIDGLSLHFPPANTLKRFYSLIQSDKNNYVQYFSIRT